MPIKAANLTGSIPKRKPIGNNTMEDFNEIEALRSDSDEDTPSGSKIKVIVRIRPFLDIDDAVKNKTRQITQNSGTMLATTDNTIHLQMDGRNKDKKEYKFDLVAGTEFSQQEVYDKSGISNLVGKVFKGYHSTIFAYGQTGSGKTYTMEGYDYTQNDKGKYVP
jgi:hypothetical protein